MEDDFSFARNLLIEKCDTEWIYFIDSDNVYNNENKGKLKRIIKILSYLKLDLVVCPIIEEYNGEITYNNQRLFRSADYRFKGRVHEELKHAQLKEIKNISCSLRIYHTGYDPKEVNQSEKLNRNAKLVKLMIDSEPKNPKWYYYYAKEMKDLTNEERLFFLSKALDLIGDNVCHDLYIETTLYYCHYLTIEKKFKLLKQTLLKSPLDNNILDITYFKLLLLVMETKIKVTKSLDIIYEELEKDKVGFIYNKSHIIALKKEMEKML
ncbi:glycosyltransferase, group 2 family protein [Bacillus sp. JCM 19047]|nr:glycosyltransferase, group 2 family protein [Bacillus sp. JCM 19047]